MKHHLLSILLAGSLFFCVNCKGTSSSDEKSSPEIESHNKANGYNSTSFELNQKYEYGDKYSAALGTYTAKHVPLAIYAEEVDKTFFVYGGTTSDTARYLLCMIGEYDHQTGTVSKSTIVYDKKGVNDPHDNPSLMIGDDGHLWVFVSGGEIRAPALSSRAKTLLTSMNSKWSRKKK